MDITTKVDQYLLCNMTGYHMKNTVQALQDSYALEGWGEFLDVIETCPQKKPTEVEELLEKLGPEEWSRQNVIECMKELDSFGFGRFYKGAKGKKTRIEWYFPPRIIAEAARGDDQELRRLMADGITQRPPADESLLNGKDTWTLGEILGLLSNSTGVPVNNLRVVMTIPEARKVLADSQGISQEEVTVRLG